MYVGTQLKARNDDDYRVFAQLGVDHVCGYPPGDAGTWNAEVLTRYREHVESFGLTVDVIPLPLGSSEISRAERPNIMLGKSPERDREIEQICEIIRACAAAGIPAVKYNMTLLGVVSTERQPCRANQRRPPARLAARRIQQPGLRLRPGEAGAAAYDRRRGGRRRDVGAHRLLPGEGRSRRRGE